MSTMQFEDAMSQESQLRKSASPSKSGRAQTAKSSPTKKSAAKKTSTVVTTTRISVNYEQMGLTDAAVA